MQYNWQATASWSRAQLVVSLKYGHGRIINFSDFKSFQIILAILYILWMSLLFNCGFCLR